MREKKKYIEVGRIINTHGVRGELKIEPWCDSPCDFLRLKRVYLADGKELSVVSSRVINGNFILCSISEIKTLDDAVKYKNKVIFADRDDLDIPDGAVLICDIIGLPVTDLNTGKVYGTLTDVIQNTSQEIYEITDENGKKTLIPAVPEFIKKCDAESGIFITPIDGFFE
ncbi:MAG: ribosome maturation factor RimM [Eubacteriales bacterium]